MRRIDSLIKRLEKLEAVKAADERSFVMVVHGGSVSMTGSELDRLLKEIDGKTRGIPCQRP